MPNRPVLKIFVSSPGDVTEERKIIYETIKELNESAFVRGKVILEPEAWDLLASRVPLPATATPQEAIDAGLTKPSQCEIVLVLFWNRFGTQLPDSYRKPENGEPYYSGTEYEFWDAYRAAKNPDPSARKPQLFVYRRTEEVPVSQRDPERDEKNKQHDRVEAFFKEVFINPDGTFKALSNDYESVADFKLKIKHDLETLVSKFLTSPTAQLPPAPVKPSPTEPTDAEIETFFANETERYVNDLKQWYVDLSGSAETSRKLSASAQVFWRACGQYIKASDGKRVEADARFTDPATQQTTTLANIFDKLLTVKKGVLLGEPGSGKTFTLLRLQIHYIDQWLNADPATRKAHPIPIIVPLREYRGQDGAFANFVKGFFGDLAPYMDYLLESGRVVLLLDALNEMPRGTNDAHVKAITEYLTAHKRAHFLISCRVRDYDGKDLDSLKPLEQVLLQDLDLPKIKQLILKRLPTLGVELWGKMGGNADLEAFWANVVEAKRIPEFWESKSEFEYGFLDSLWNGYRQWMQMHQNARLIPLCRNPFMASLLCGIYEEKQGNLPNSRAELFGGFAETLLNREKDNAESIGRAWPPTALEEIETGLVKLSEAMQKARGTILKRSEALQSLKGLELAPGWLIDTAIAASLLIQDGEGDSATVRFAHQLLQEYYACRVLLAALEHDEQHNTNTAGQFFKDHGGEGWWEAGVWGETIVILGEFLNDPNRVARWLAPVSPEVGLSAILRNGAGLTVKDVQPETFEVVRKTAWLLAEEPDPRGRASAYRALGLFDPTIYDSDRRAGVGVFWSEQHKLWLPDIAWCDVPGGEFIMESDDYDDEKSRRIEKVASFRMAKYPITHRQYQCFLDDPEGYHNPEWRKHLHPNAAKNMRHPGDQGFKFWNHPRETVNWYEVMAFCGWATARLGFAVTLPTERQWERAARGKNGLIYPYEGDFDPLKGNTYETGIRQTSAVGIFPEGASPEDILDLSGNVLEWMLNEYDDTTNISSITDKHRSVRGGSWLHNSILARSSARGRFNLYDLLSGLGFRLVALSSIP
jgi:formylglycine-generating enzyme required for sulfatase activity